MNMHKTIAAALVSAVWLTAANADDGFVVKDIRVEGLQRTEAGTVFSYLPVKVGEQFDSDKADQAIHALYATGFFRDVHLERQGNVLVVAVVERPSIDKINITGNDEFTTEQLTDGLKQANLANGLIFDQSALDRATQEIKRLYYSHGHYSAEVTATVTPLARNRVDINFKIDEGKVARIHDINFVGNQVFTEKQLRKVITLTTPNWLTWYTKDDQYSREKLSGDLESLRSWYLDHGYLEFNIDSTQVQITPDRTNIYLTINLTEGDRYTVTGIKLAGNLLVPEDELRKLIAIQPGDIFSRKKVTEASKAIGDRLGKDGYAFANVNAVPQVDKDKHTVSFTFVVDPGHRVYVRHISFHGNDRTRDEVVRREFRQMEGAWYASDLIQLSKMRVQRLGYFSDVTVDTPPVPGTNDQVDLSVKVKEIPTGSIMAGVGFASQEGLILSGSISQNDLFGSGNALTLSINSSPFSEVYSLSYTNPYTTADGLSSGYDIYKNVTNTSYLSTLAPFKNVTVGMGGRLAIPLNEKDTMSLGLAIERIHIDALTGSPPPYVNFVNQYGSYNNNLRFTWGWARDTRDSLIYPTKGMLERVYGELGVPPGSLEYYKVSYQQQWFKPITKSLVLELNGEVGAGGGFGGQGLPFFEYFYAGGVNDVRGYDISTIGPKYYDPISGMYIASGGSKRIVGNAELMFPMPGMEDNHQVRLSVFVDMGDILGPGGESFSSQPMRYSTGFALNWISPVGPLKFSLAHALNPQPYDVTAPFQFTLGQVF